MTIRYATAAAIVLAAVTLTVSAFAEGSQYQTPAAPVDPNARLPGVIQIEQFLDKSGVNGLNTVKEPARTPAQPVQAAAPTARPAQPAFEPVVLTAPEPPASAQPARYVASNRPAAAPLRRETSPGQTRPTMIRIAAPAFADSPSGADGAVPAEDIAMLYAPPVRSPWWERLLSSRGFLYAMAFCLLAVPVAGFTASSLIGYRREERDLPSTTEG